MNENINLCEILKGHEGETFYSPAFGDIKLNCITYIIYFESISGKVSFDIYPNGTYCSNGELIIFPSKDQRDWNKWIEEQKSKVPKTWSELVKHIQPILYAEISHKSDGHYTSVSEDCGNTPIEKSALALLKIHQLIEVGYGGNVNDWEWKDMSITKWRIGFDCDGEIMIDYCVSPIAYTPIAFHTKEQAEEFLKYPENIQLLKDYFIILKKNE